MKTLITRNVARVVNVLTRRIIFCLLSLLVPIDASSGAATLMVTNGDDDGPGSLREAIRDAMPGDTIQFTFTGTIVLTSGELLVDKNLTITGPGSNILTVSRDPNADQGFRLLEVAAGTTVTLSGITLADGALSGMGGGGILNSGFLSLSEVQLIDNRVGPADLLNSPVNGGGCVNVAGATMMLTNCFVTGNSSNGNGGAILNDGDLTVQSSTISNNTGADGGGIYSDGSATITNCTISGNGTVPNGPHGLGGGYGGGLSLSGSAVLVSDTISGNQCIWEGGGMMTGDTVVVTNCILAGNTSETGHQDTVDLFGTVQSGGHNLVGVSTSGDGFGPSDLFGTSDTPLDARLGPLQNNGGPTLTMALIPGSPAIDQGVDGDLLTDERGLPRTIDQSNVVNSSGSDGTDIGAFELSSVSPTLLNISTRLEVGTDSDLMIVGFIVTGTQPKKVILRAIGPSLSGFGVLDALSDPVLELHDSGGAVLMTNDNWRESPDQQAIIDSGVSPTSDIESAIIATLDPGEYTAVVSGANGATGVGLVEVYDLDHSADSILANLSTRGLVETDEKVMIAGLIVAGDPSPEVVLRALGSSLPLTGTLGDPTLQVYDLDGAVVAENDNWKDEQEAEIEAAGLAPNDDLEAAILLTLPPGTYTAIVRGQNNTTGVASVEAYNISP